MNTTVGVVLCDCKGAMAEHLDFDVIVARLSEEASVCVCDDLCAASCVKKAGLEFKKKGITALVIGACCSPAAKTIVRNALIWAKWGDNNTTFCDIRERCAFPHKDREEATQKCIVTLRSAIAKAAIGTMFTGESTGDTKVEQSMWDDSVVVIGGGIGGMACAIALNALQRSVTIIEQGSVLGGKSAGQVFLEDDPLNPALVTAEMSRQISNNKRINTRLGCEATQISGSPGSFRVKLHDSAGEEEISAGAVAIATGNNVRYAKEVYGFDTGANIIALSDFEDFMQKESRSKVEKFRGKRIGFIVDVSTLYSKTYITRALKYAKHLNDNYGTETFVFCDDVKVAGFGLEASYRASRSSGTVVFKYEGTPPEIEIGGNETGGEIRIKAFVPSLGGDFLNRCLEIPLDILVLDEKVETALCLREFGPSLGVNGCTDRFFQPPNIRLQPSDTGRPGIWVIGGCRGDLDLEATLIDARSAANRIDQWLKAKAVKNYISIDPEKCARCLTCVRLCPSNALSIDAYTSGKQMSAHVDDRSCRGCGVCAAVCPARAITFLEYVDDQVFGELRLLGGLE